MTTMSFPSNQRPFHLWMKQRRAELDLSRTELADLVGCSLAMIRQLEQGRRRPSRQLAERLARYLQIAPEDRQSFMRVARVPLLASDSQLAMPAAHPTLSEQLFTQSVSAAARLAGRSALPTQPDQLIGRERELKEALALIASPNIQLLTLTGPGGVGKTRLSIQLAYELWECFADHAYFIGLAALSEAERIPHAIAQALQLLDVLAAPSPERLIAALCDREVLLLLDNLEHLPDSASLLATLIQSCPSLKIIATSRSALRLRAETLYPIPPLALPDLLAPGGAAATVCGYPAVQLFVSRAQRVQPGFALTDENVGAVVEICRRLDGLPLALELAAARVRGLPPRTMLSRLGNRLDFLVGGMRDLPARQQTLRDLLDWSYSLLDAYEQQLFRRLAVFVGGWTLNAAEVVCSLPEEHAPALVDTLCSLLNHSLIGERQLAEDEAGFGMLELIREYALEQLEASGEAHLLRQRHADYYLALVEQAEPQLTRRQQRAWLDRLESAHDNIRVALDCLTECGERERALRLIGALWRFWQFCNYQREGLRWADAALALPLKQQEPPAVSIRVLCGAGWLANDCGDYRRAETLFATAAAHAREVEDWPGLGLALHGIGSLAMSHGDGALAIACAEESLTIFRRLGDQEQIAWTLQHLGAALQFQGDDQAAIGLYEESLALLRSVGHYWGLIRILLTLAHVWIEQGAHQQANTLLDESLALCREQRYHRLTIETLRYLGRAALDQGAYARAAALFESSLELARSLQEGNGVRWALAHLGQATLAQGQTQRAQALLGQAYDLTSVAQEPWAAAWITTQLGHVARQQGECDLAWSRYAKSLRFYHDNNLHWGIPECLEGLGVILAMQPAHDSERAALLLSGAEALRRALQHAQPASIRLSCECALAALRERLGVDRLSTIWQAGQSASLAMVVAAALGNASEEEH